MRYINVYLYLYRFHTKNMLLQMVSWLLLIRFFAIKDRFFNLLLVHVVFFPTEEDDSLLLFVVIFVN